MSVFLLRKVWLPPVSSAPSAKSDNTLCYRLLKVNERSWSDWPWLKSTVTHRPAVYFSYFRPASVLHQTNENGAQCLQMWGHPTQYNVVQYNTLTIYDLQDKHINNNSDRFALDFSGIPNRLAFNVWLLCLKNDINHSGCLSWSG